EFFLFKQGSDRQSATTSPGDGDCDADVVGVCRGPAVMARRLPAPGIGRHPGATLRVGVAFASPRPWAALGPGPRDPLRRDWQRLWFVRSLLGRVVVEPVYRGGEHHGSDSVPAVPW